MEKRVYLLIGIFVFTLFSINFIFAACEGIVDCSSYNSASTNCVNYGCTWDVTGICINSTQHQPSDPDCGINDHEFQCLDAAPSCEWVHCYGDNVDCPNVGQAECDAIVGCQYDCCTGVGQCEMYLIKDNCPLFKGCFWDTNSRCEGGEIPNEGGLTCGDLNYQWMCDYYSSYCTWFGEGCTGTFTCLDDKTSCTLDLGCYWNCPPCEVWWYIDLDEDLYSDGTSQYDCNDPGSNYFLESELTATIGDCNDLNELINPGMPEICDNIDNNCTGGVDENLIQSTTCGVGACAGNTGEETCTAGVWGGDTCDPYEGALAEICDDVNEIDEDCDGLTNCDDTVDCPSALPTDPCYTCISDCTGKECGLDECGETCPPGCELGEICVDYACEVPNLFWSLDGDTEIDPLPTEADPLEINLGDVVYLVIEDSGYPEGAIPFSVYEDDWLSDDEIRGGKTQYIQGTVDASGKAVATWTITEADLIEASSDIGDDESGIYDTFEFYFAAGTSEEFKSGIFYTVHIEPELYWADESEYEITTPIITTLIPHNIKLIAGDIASSGSIVSFNIWERDTSNDDDDIWTGTAVVDANKKAVLVFKIDSGNLTKAVDGTGVNENSINDEMEFYFEIISLESEDLLFTYDLSLCDGITLCSQYDSFTEPATSCDNDDCEVNTSWTDCEEGYTCLCEWDDTTGCDRGDYAPPNIDNNVCVWCIDGVSGDWCDMPEGTNDYCDTTGTGCGVGDPITSSIYCDAIDFAIGSCTYLTDDLGDDCDDGYLTYDWGGQWGWNDVANSFDPPDPDPEGDDFLESPIGSDIWRYDPTLLSVDCDAKGGTSSAICPAQIELPFFGTWGIIVTIALIIIIYMALNLKKHKPKKRKEK